MALHPLRGRCKLFHVKTSSRIHLLIFGAELSRLLRVGEQSLLPTGLEPEIFTVGLQSSAFTTYNHQAVPFKP